MVGGAAEDAASGRPVGVSPSGEVRFVMVVNKIDLLPRYVSHARLEQWVRPRRRRPRTVP